MADSRFASHARLWLLVAPLLLGFVVPMLPDDGRFDLSAAERLSVVSTLGAPKEGRVVEQANARFQRWFVDTGAVGFFHEDRRETTPIRDGGAAEMTARWLAHFWSNLYRAVYRATVMQAWLPGLLMILFAAINDGAVHRRIRAAAARMASPVSFHLAAHGFLLILGLGASALLLPFTLHAEMCAMATIAFAVLGWRMAASNSSFA